MTICHLNQQNDQGRSHLMGRNGCVSPGKAYCFLLEANRRLTRVKTIPMDSKTFLEIKEKVVLKPQILFLTFKTLKVNYKRVQYYFGIALQMYTRFRQ